MFWLSHHLKGQGCKKCISELNDGRWYERIENANKIANMYILKFSGNNETFFKFGISVNVDKRVVRLEKDSNETYEIEIIKSLTNTAEYCYKLEQRVKRIIRYKKLQYIPKIKFGGMYECFKI